MGCAEAEKYTYCVEVNPSRDKQKNKREKIKQEM